MSDQTVVATTGEKRTRRNQFARLFDKGAVEFRHGELVDGKRPVIGQFEVANLPEGVTRNLLVVGLATTLNGVANDDGDAVENVQSLYRELQAGNWPESERGGVRDETVFHEALVLVAKAQGKKIGVERAAEVWANMSAEKRASVQESKGFKAAVAKVKADRAVAKKTDAPLDIDF